MRIQRLRVKNFRAFRDVTIEDLPPFALFVGANGSGKSTLFEIFGFLRDALESNASAAVAKRGGFRELRSREAQGDLSFEIKFREENGPLVTYSLVLTDREGRTLIAREALKYRRGQQGKPWYFLDFREGEGYAVTNEADYITPNSAMEREYQKLGSPDILALKGLGQFDRFKAASTLRRLLERWHLSDFHVDAARSSQEDGYAEHLSRQGENLPLVAHFLYDKHPAIFKKILERMKQRVPGISSVEATSTVDGRLVLRFQDGAFRDPFLSRHVSDGTIKMFAYLVLLYDPSPHPLLCIEEPENQLYPTLLPALMDEFREYARRGGQVMMSTHSPDLFQTARLEEIFWLEKRNGSTQISRVCKNQQVLALLAEGDTLRDLWKQGLLRERSE